MPRRVEPKSELVFRAAKARARSYLLANGNGLALRVQPNGTDGRPLPRAILYAKAPIRSSIAGPSPPHANV